MRLMIVLSAAVVLSGCGGRVAVPVQVFKDVDAQLTCDHLQAEYNNNIRRVGELTGESSDKVRDNIGLLLVSPLFLDLSGTQKTEVTALHERNKRLQGLSAQKQCAPIT
ncbi:hypothetical protein OVA03_01210 [Asticcacaulis sp. SL142]|uniref:hypothetical protein n=1 Tax=Asticcacaulis sp. SL142 TaxID=2995155 RepID=UPI00226CACB6|nr:hypothetical protein [Asticcacaulis sp. SL142]WAC48584.1 hypothetical protein OVA03_01210 [Asticcacaulis sp. SL142]